MAEGTGFWQLRRVRHMLLSTWVWVCQNGPSAEPNQTIPLKSRLKSRPSNPVQCIIQLWSYLWRNLLNLNFCWLEKQYTKAREEIFFLLDCCWKLTWNHFSGLIVVMLILRPLLEFLKEEQDWYKRMWPCQKWSRAHTWSRSWSIYWQWVPSRNLPPPIWVGASLRKSPTCLTHTGEKKRPMSSMRCRVLRQIKFLCSMTTLFEGGLLKISEPKWKLSNSGNSWSPVSSSSMGWNFASISILMAGVGVVLNM